MKQQDKARCPWAKTEWYVRYHDTEWGVPVHDDRLLFEFLILEGAQAGLSWETILKKRENYRRAFDNFDPALIARYGQKERKGLLADAGIIRNRLKVAAVIENARRIRQLRTEHGSFDAWLRAHHPRPAAEWVKLFKRTFRFTGGEIVGEFLMSVGYLPGAHMPDCPVYARICALAPPWVDLAGPAQGCCG